MKARAKNDFGEYCDLENAANSQRTEYVASLIPTYAKFVRLIEKWRLYTSG